MNREFERILLQAPSPGLIMPAGAGAAQVQEDVWEGS